MLPRSVQDQADAAKTLQDNLNQPSDSNENPAQATLEAQQQSQQAQPEAQPANEQQQETRDASYWRHRFDVLQGKYNAEVPALRKEIATLTSQVASSAKPESAIQRAQDAMSDLTEDEIDEYGPDLVNFIKRVAGNAANSGGDGDIQKMKAQLEQLQDDKTQDATARFWVDLETQVPNFRAIDPDPSFHQYLAGVDPLSGMTRQQLLVDAQRALDPYRVAAIFKSFSPQQKAQQNTIPDELIQPRQSRSSTTDIQQGKTWTRNDISEFYRNKASYPKDQAAAIEADIFAAQSQGRIR